MTASFAHRLNLFFFIATLFLILMIRINPPIWTGYGDPYDYLKQSKAPLFSKEFLSPEKSEGYYPRPFSVPLFYKIAGSDPDRIVILQRFLHALATFFLCFAVLLFVRKIYAQITFVVLWYLLMSWWNILGWTNTLLSESISISLMFCWLASFLLFLKTRSWPALAFHVLITVLFSFTRDSWPYALIIFYSLFAFLSFITERKLLPQIAGLLLSSAVIFLVQQKTAETGQRYRLPVMNNIVFRVLPEERYLDWFVARGMPDADLLREKYGNLSDWKMIYPLYNDTAFHDFSEWVAVKGRSLYMKFLLTHPENMLLLHEPREELKKIFAYDIGYTGDPAAYSRIAGRVFPLFHLIPVLLLNALLLLACYGKKSLLKYLPSVLILVFACNAVLLYVADSLEKERHLFITNISIQFIGLLILTLLLDSDRLEGIFAGGISKLFRRT